MRSLVVLLAATTLFSGCASNALRAAVRQGDIAAARQALARGADPNYHPKFCNGVGDCDAVLLIAVNRGDLPMIEMLLDHGAKGLDGALYQAIGLRNLALAKSLVDHGAAVTGYHVRHAIEANDPDVLMFLLDSGFKDLNTVGAGGAGRWTILDHAVHLKKPDMVRILVAGGAKTAAQVDAETKSQLDAAMSGAPVVVPAPVHRARKAARPSNVDEPAYQAAVNPNDFAIVIGIEKYSQDLPAAQFAEHDANAVRDHLAALGVPPRNIALLTGDKAGLAGIKKNVESWLPNHANENSTVYFYFSGHGSPDPSTSQAYLVPWDGDPQYLKDTAYPLKRLYSQLGALKAKRVVVMLDSCFSGREGRSVIAQGTRPLVSKIEMGYSDDAKVVTLSASAQDQVSGTNAEASHGLFTYYFLKGLNGAAADKDGKVTLRGLYGYLSAQVADAARQDNREQSPQMTPASGGAFELR